MYYNYAKNPIFERITINRQRRNLELSTYQNKLFSESDIKNNSVSPFENSAIQSTMKRAFSPNEPRTQNLQFIRSRLFSQQNNSTLWMDSEQVN